MYFSSAMVMEEGLGVGADVYPQPTVGGSFDGGIPKHSNTGFVLLEIGNSRRVIGYQGLKIPRYRNTSRRSDGSLTVL